MRFMVENLTLAVLTLSLLGGLGCNHQPVVDVEPDQGGVSIDSNDTLEGMAEIPVPQSIEECAAMCAAAPLYVMSRISFSHVDQNGTSQGFDLDNADAMCGVQDLVHPQGRKGIDNRLGELFAVLPEAAVDVLPGIIQTSIDSGQLSVLVEAVGVHDYQVAMSTFMVLRMGQGAVLHGADGHILASQTFGLDPDPVLGVAESAEVGDGALVAGPFEFEIRLRYLGNKMAFRLFRGRVHYTHDPIADTISGTMGGVVPLEDVVTLANRLGGDDEDIKMILLELLPDFVDAQTLPNGPCDGLSTAIRFEGLRAFVYDE